MNINVDGLRDLPRDDLTPEEIAEIERQDDVADAAEIENIVNSVESIAEMLRNQYGESAPDKYQLEAWKDAYGVINISSVFGGDDIYLWKTMTRAEYKKLVKGGMLNDEMRAEDMIVRKHLLYPEPNDVFMSTTPAGVIPVLKSQIMYQSGFVSEREALSLIRVI